MVYTSALALITQIKKEVGQLGNKIAKGIASIAFEDLKQAHKSIMEDYYAGYTPCQTYFYNYVSTKPRGDGYNGTFAHYMGFAHGYRRTYNLRDNSIISHGVKPSGKHSFVASVGIGPDNMSDYVNSTNHTFPASGVFDLVWNQGIRGLPPGHRGYIGPVDINTSPVGVNISGKPVQAMDQFLARWVEERGSQVAEMIFNSV